ncbi:LOW QUALITY PROTEIN: geranylgeranyl transferase type-2 subunit alpha [Aquila chrysaetos chrysaetos]|uniref:LOW QUALITY PROTEIN: geranylgeranyl transferase type-2 subunit alpha n=1 Tax=Aquila chrysaetos chrysaetos TaxID=223781 RepID=UPI0011770278|nr:LOW QUALITY PROTEIN: geranylgeranyl transferase type-2 subunit alpha [Aquila chrysaetos chrysaetos]
MAPPCCLVVSQHAPRLPRPAPFPAAFAPPRVRLQRPAPVPDPPPPPPPGAVAMHGRLKLRPPDAARRRQREEKLRLYRSSMATLLEKRERGELDAEALALTGAVLAANPDVGTCWNLRRCALPPDPADWVPGELAFVVGCLGVNPKSYGAWHHRGWVLRRARAPPPTPAERALCDRLLAADPRNFHAWEHRRTLAAEEDPEAELAFAGTLLSRDFSNFSAWHHRSRLLAPTRTPASPGGGAGALPPHRLQTELELVQNAVFTDPNDQSAWVYLRCILSRASPPPRILCLYVNREDATLAVTFSRPVVVGAGSSALTATVDGSALEGAWRSGEGRPRPSHTWVCDLPPDLAPPPTRPRLHFRVTWEPDPAPREVTLLPDENEAWWQEPIKAGELFWPEVGVAEASVLEAQVETCRQLLELEPRSRGCLLTLVLLLSALDPLGHEDEIRRCLRDLQEADPLRIGFVGDVASRAEAAVGVLRMGAGPDGAVRLRLHRKALTSLPLLEHTVLVTHLDLAGNNLGGLPPTLGGAAAPAGAGRVTQQGHDPAGVPAPPPPGGAASRRQPHKPRLRPGPIGHVPPAGSSAIG